MEKEVNHYPDESGALNSALGIRDLLIETSDGPKEKASAWFCY